MFKTVLIANRGEIAVRIIRTLRKLGVRSAAVFSDSDAYARHVVEADVAAHLGPTPPHDSYLNIERIMAAADRLGADALHPGYGFLSENSALARACVEAGVVFVGPRPETIDLMGDKIRAKQTVAAAGVAIVPGRTEAELSDDDLIAAAEEVGYPVMIKPSAGGGGKGMRLVERRADMPLQLASARRESSAAFGDDTLFVERYINGPRHIEVQVLADGHGNLVNFGERECSLQRRHQKIIEEAPSPLLDERSRREISLQATTAAAACGYVNAGTVEFIVSADHPNEPFFMEMNTRLQVEHPVTEAVWGVDLVELQLRIASGEALPFNQEDLHSKGHAIEARVYAEDPSRGFLPTGGTVLHLSEPSTELARVDSGIMEGSEIGSIYDPMLSKIVTWAPDRDEAVARLDRALAATEILGVMTNVGFLRNLLALEAVRYGHLDTGLVERELAYLPSPEPTSDDVAVAAVLATLTKAELHQTWDQSGWRLGETVKTRWEADTALEHHEAELQRHGRGWLVWTQGCESEVQVDLTGVHARAEVSGQSRNYVAQRIGQTLWVGREGRAWSFTEPAPIALGGRRITESGAIQSPMPGAVTAVFVAEGQQVDPGEPILVVEAMKMEHTLISPVAGRVAAVHVKGGDQVGLGQTLAVIEEDHGV
jgi:acetyl-CoA/propionyl-CoA carboxylase, biotin carboxylase, biotin carboxyl carrier protein